MWIIHAVWIFVVVTTLVKLSQQGTVAALNHGIPAVVTGILVTVVVLFVRRLIQPKASKKATTEPVKVHLPGGPFNKEPEQSISTEQRFFEESLYAKAYDEINENKFSKGIMAKAIAESDGNSDKLNSLYIKYRVQSLKDEIKLTSQEELQQQTVKNFEESKLVEEQSKQKIKHYETLKSVNEDDFTRREILVFCWLSLGVCLVGTAFLLAHLAKYLYSSVSNVGNNDSLAGTIMGLFFTGIAAFVLIKRIRNLKW